MVDDDSRLELAGSDLVEASKILWITTCAKDAVIKMESDEYDADVTHTKATQHILYELFS